MKFVLVSLAAIIVAGCAGNERSSVPVGGSSAELPAPAAEFDRRAESEPPADLPELTAESTLADFLTYAALNNPGLEERFYQFIAASEQVPQAEALPDPTLNFNYVFSEQEFRLGIMQMFPWFGTIQARTDAASQRAKASARRFEAARLALANQVTDVYAEYVYLGSAIEIAAANLELLEYFEEVALTQFEADQVSYADVVRAQLELAVMEDVLRGLEELRPAIAGQLNAILGRDPQAPVEWPRPIEPARVAVETDKVITLLRQRNPDLEALRHQIEAAEQEVTLAEKRFMPDLGVGVEWMHVDNPRMRDMRRTGSDAVMVMFSMTLPIWRDSYSAGQSQAQALARQERLARDDAENMLISQAQQSVYEYSDSLRKLDLYQEVLLPRADELLAASEAGYQAGTVDFLSLIDAQRVLLQYELEYARAVADNAQSLARLRQLTAGGVLADAQDQSY